MFCHLQRIFFLNIRLKIIPGVKAFHYSSCKLTRAKEKKNQDAFLKYKH